MKYLSNYTEERQTAIFNKYGVFFAFSQKQFDEASKPDVKYTSLDYGMIIPSEHVKTVMGNMKTIQADAIQEDIKENGIKAIIHRELSNFESQVSMDCSDTVNALTDYGITEEQVKAEWPEYFQKCIDNDWF